jgi:hypothetical protein
VSVLWFAKVVLAKKVIDASGSNRNLKRKPHKLRRDAEASAICLTYSTAAKATIAKRVQQYAMLAGSAHVKSWAECGVDF